MTRGWSRPFQCCATLPGDTVLSEVGQLRKGEPWGLGGGEQKLSDRVLALCVKPRVQSQASEKKMTRTETVFTPPLSEVPGAVREESGRLSGGGVAAQNSDCLKPHSWT